MIRLRPKRFAATCLPLLSISEDDYFRATCDRGNLPYAYHVEPSGIIRYCSPKPKMMIEAPFLVPRFRLSTGYEGNARTFVGVHSFVDELKALGAKCAFEHCDDQHHSRDFIFWFDLSSTKNQAYCCVSAFPSTLRPSITPVIYAKEIDSIVMCRMRVLDLALSGLLRKHRIPLRNRIPRCGPENIDRLFS